MKLTNEQRAEYLARFLIGRMPDNQSTVEKDITACVHALELFEAEIAKWEEPKPKAPIRNPENIDFSKYPIPKGYTVASEEDCRGGIKANWLALADGYWVQIGDEDIGRICPNWTYLRPLREGEK